MSVTATNGEGFGNVRLCGDNTAQQWHVFTNRVKVKVKFSRYRPEQALGDPVG
jgi:hypothetical protein